MAWRRLLEPEIQSFIKAHASDDPAILALKKPPQKDWPYALILGQIKSRQKAQTKIPQWLKLDNIIFPAGDVMEQASSSAAAQYKAGLMQGDIFADITGGSGIDCQAIAKNFASGFCIECDEDNAALLAHNLKILCGGKISVQHTKAENFINDMPKMDWVYIDPQRRTSSRKGIYRLEDCSPDITKMLSVLKIKTQRLMIKTSPMLDIQAGIKTLAHVQSVHVTEWRGECRECLYILDFSAEALPKMHAVEIDDDGNILKEISFTKAQEEHAQAEYALPEKFLYEPGPAFQKIGAYNYLARQYGVKKLHQHTHLYTSQEHCAAFPGRHFEVIDSFPVDGKSLPVAQANLTLRNFPGTAESLRKKLKLKDGGPDTLFACTLMNAKKALLHVRKIAP